MSKPQTSYAWIDTAIGRCAIAWTARGICNLSLPGPNEAETVQRLAPHGGTLALGRPPTWVRKAIRLVTRHLEGRPQRLDGVQLDLGGLPSFHRRVYEALLRVGSGQTVSYGELARRAGSPRAARAVGQALARNPIGVIVPCHRVLASDGGPGGFSASGSIATKARLLRLEGVEQPWIRPAAASTPQSRATPDAAPRGRR